MGDTWQDKMLVATIDFGTTYSGFALSFRTDYEEDKANILTKTWQADAYLVTNKTPTVLLLNPDATLHSFGYNAEKKYAALAEIDEHKSWRYFRRFKMKLYSDKTRQGISVNSKIKDTEGRDFRAIDVFAFSIEYMKKEIIKTARQSYDAREEELFYVLTVPAIWSNQAKYFMRIAASHAQIPEDHLRIALEPECAAVFIQKKYLPSLADASNDKSKDIMMPGSCHIIVDMGGGTCDIAAHVVNESNTFDEMIPPEGGPYGAENINAKFEQFLISISGAPAFTEFKDEHMEDFLELQRQFEQKKRSFNENDDVDVVTIRLPESFRKLHVKKNVEELSQSVRQMKIKDDIEFKNEKMRIKNAVFRDFFKETVDGVLKAVDEVIRKVPHKVSTLICVGGFADCELIKSAFVSKFHDKTVIIPPDSVTAIMKGGIIYGRDESIINTRICRFTLGLDWNEDFQEGIHPENKREETEEGFLCRDIFRKITQKGQHIEYHKPTEEIDAYVKSRYQTVLDFPFYRSEIQDSPKYIDDVGCHLMGTMTVNLGADNKQGLDRCVKLKIYCGKSELTAEAEDDKGQKYNMTFKYSETQV